MIKQERVVLREQRARAEQERRAEMCVRQVARSQRWPKGDCEMVLQSLGLIPTVEARRVRRKP